MNYFVLINGAVYLAATLHSIKLGHWEWAAIWLCYSVSAFVMCALEAK